MDSFTVEQSLVMNSSKWFLEISNRNVHNKWSAAFFRWASAFDLWSDGSKTRNAAALFWTWAALAEKNCPNDSPNYEQTVSKRKKKMAVPVEFSKTFFLQTEQKNNFLIKIFSCFLMQEVKRDPVNKTASCWSLTNWQKMATQHFFDGHITRMNIAASKGS